MLLLLINFYLICAYSYHNKVGIPKIIKNSLYVASENECKTSIILFPGFGKNGKSYTGLCNKISANGIFIAIEAAAIFLFPVKPFMYSLAKPKSNDPEKSRIGVIG